MNVPNDPTAEVALARRRDDDGNPFYESRLTPVTDDRTKVLRVKTGYVIPILFIPGIVWCAGYNWLQSNRDSVKDVKRFIEGTVFEHYRQRGLEAEKVVLVTHSMGGLVARALIELEGYDRVLGVVHGVQPATGSPAIYHHMRAGYEGIPATIVGGKCVLRR